MVQLLIHSTPKRLDRARIAQFVRYAAVSVIATVTSAVVLTTLVATETTSAVWANVIATAIGTVPSFELNRRWVWRRTDGRSLRREVVPFWVLSFSGLVLSTAFVALAERWSTAVGVGGSLHTVVVEIASLAGFGALWVLQFLVLDRLLFARQV